MKIGIVGWGIEGQSAYHFFGSSHEYLIVNEEPRDDFPPQSDIVKVQFNNQIRLPGITGNSPNLSYLSGLETCDKIVYSVTSHKNLEQFFGDDKGFWKKAVTTQHIFFETVKTKNIIGVTGTKGKGTTTTMIFEMLKAALRQGSGQAGPNVFLGGNIGTSVLDILPDVRESDWVVLELSNFQLYNFPYSPHIAVCLMITNEHQDWHANMEEYLSAKISLFSHQTSKDIAIYFADNDLSKQIAGNSPGAKLPYFASPGARINDENIITVDDPDVEIINVKDVKLLGKHNLENICAAVTVVWQITKNQEALRQVLSSFRGLEHRLEFVRELDQVKYYDDSFGTTPETAVVAIKSFVEPKVLIVGGHDKGLPFEPLVDEIINSRVRKVILIGETSSKIEAMLAEKGYINIQSGLVDMEEIVEAARQASSPGDVVLLSPGCSSFGLFHDYKDRGDQFKAAVNSLV